MSEPGQQLASDAERWIYQLGLQRHAEGGWYREVYRASERISRAGLPSRFRAERAFSTAIYFLLSGSEFSALHRIQQDELWHHYDGGTLTLHMIRPEGDYSTARLGRDADAGDRLVQVVEAGVLFGASVNDPASYTLAGCTVAPGFEFDDFELPGRAELVRRYPQHRGLIERLTRHG